MNQSTAIQSSSFERQVLTLTENSQQLRGILESALDSNLYRLVSAQSASECLQIVEGSKIAFVDLILNDMDGLSLIEELRAHHRQMHIIAVLRKEEFNSLDITADSIKLMASQSGANAVFIAPFNLGELIQTVERFCDLTVDISA